jgi:hypothetical protein
MIVPHCRLTPKLWCVGLDPFRRRQIQIGMALFQLAVTAAAAVKSRPPCTVAIGIIPQGVDWLDLIESCPGELAMDSTSSARPSTTRTTHSLCYWTTTQRWL